MRTEKDSLGFLEVPEQAYYGIQSLRAANLFQVSGTQIHPELIRSYLLLKRAAALANQDAGALTAKQSDAIVYAVDELLKTDFSKHFIVDTYQAGAGTSQNMNVNEVIANWANESLGHKLGTYDPIHPHDHVNASQSTNDTYPTVMRLAVLKLSESLLDAIVDLENAFSSKGREFDDVIKSARTHLQDAVPIRLGQAFQASATVLKSVGQLFQHARQQLKELSIGGSAVGTGINVPPGYRESMIARLKEHFAITDLCSAGDLIAATQSQLPMLIYSSALRALAVELTRIFNDLRLLSSGPHTGLAEIHLPAVMPGSSIMPGKINPSALEMGNQVCFKVLGNDTAMSHAVQAGQLELNVMMPLMAHLALESTQLITQAMYVIREHCIDGITANVEKCRHYVESSPEIVTALNPVIGYEKATELVKIAVQENISVLDVVKRQRLLTDAELAELLDAKKLTQPPLQ